jgi:hypothetical protein
MSKEKIINPLYKTKVRAAHNFVICNRSFNTKISKVKKSYCREWDITYKYRYGQGLRICLKKVK